MVDLQLLFQHQIFHFCDISKMHHHLRWIHYRYAVFAIWKFVVKGQMDGMLYISGWWMRMCHSHSGWSLAVMVVHVGHVDITPVGRCMFAYRCYMLEEVRMFT